MRFDNVPFGRTQFAPTLWTKSVTVGAQSLRPPIDWDIIPTQVPYLLCNLLTHGTKINSYSKEELTNLLNEANVAVFEKKPYLPKSETQYNVSLLVWGTN